MVAIKHESYGVDLKTLSITVRLHQFLELGVAFDLEMHYRTILTYTTIHLMLSESAWPLTDPVTFKFMCSLSPGCTSGFTSGCKQPNKTAIKLPIEFSAKTHLLVRFRHLLRP